MAVPTMVRTGYDARLSAGSITAGGSLGILIPMMLFLAVASNIFGV